MAFLYNSDSYMCRCNRNTKLYKNPTDTIATFGAVLSIGEMFISEKSVTIGKLVLFQITAGTDKTPNVPIGYWCPGEVLNMMPIAASSFEPQTERAYDDSRLISDSVFIKQNKITLYDKKDSTTPLYMEFKPGMTINVDREIVINCNGERQTRYHISDTNSIYFDKWILSGPYIQLVSTIAKPTATLRAASVTPYDETEGSETPGITPEFESGPDDWMSETDRLDRLSKFDENDEQRLEQLAGELDSIYGTYWNDYNSTSTTLQSVPIGRMTFVHGMPFQYNYITDRRRYVTQPYGYIDEGAVYQEDDIDTYGHEFAKNIAANMPIIVFVPGEPNYLTKQATGATGMTFGGNSKVASMWNNFWGDLTSDESTSLVQNIIEAGGSYDYFTLKVDMTKYHYNVNALCQSSAMLMGLKDTPLDAAGNKCGSYDWKDYNQSVAHDYSTFSEVLGLDGGVSFAYDPQSSISDTINNSTTESQIFGYFKSMSAAAKEAAFLARQAGVGTMGIGEQDSASISSAIMDSGDATLVNLGKRAVDFAINAAQGFNIRFPEIWDDSSHSRSYDIDMHFITPYATAFCKWRYVLVPFFMLFSMAAPRAEKNMSVYGAPNIVKAFSKGYFNVEIGIIESLTWRRYGEGDMISSDGVPTQMDVSVSFKDLYHVLTLSHTNGATAMAAFFNNTGLMDMIGTLSGVDMNRVGLPERISLYLGASKNAVLGLGSNFMQHIQDRVANFLERQWFM